MKKKAASSYRMVLRLARPLLHIVLVLAIFWVGYLVRQSTDLIPWFQLTIPAFNLTETMWFAISATAIFVGAGFLVGLYDLFKPLHGYYRKFLLARMRWVVCMTFLALFGNGFIFTDGISRFLILWSALCGFIALSVFDIFWNNRNSYLEKNHPYKIVVIYKTEAQYAQFAEDISGYKIYELIPVQEKEYDETRRWGIVDIVIAVGAYSTNTLQTIADHARNHGKTFYHIPESYFLEDLIAEPQRIGPVVGRAYSSSPLDGWLRVLKRFCDFVASLLAIIVLSPIFLIIALLIKIDSKGPVFYIQQRVGRKGVPFRFIKFRSMYTHLSTGKNYGGKKAQKMYDELIATKNARDHILPKIEDDPRVTKLGRFLRKTSLDELPQLFNVFIGTMSLVGPRPHLPPEVAKYEPRMKRLLVAKPGLTGYAQVFGRDNLPFEQEAHLELYYIQHWSLAMDLQVLISTVRVVLGGK